MDVRLYTDGDIVGIPLRREKFIPYKMIAGTNGQWIVYYIFKLILFVVIGVFTAPFTSLWAIYKVIRAFR